MTSPSWFGMSIETCATSDDAFYDTGEVSPNDPKHPDGEGWRLVSAVICAASPARRYSRVIWYWERIINRHLGEVAQVQEKR